MGNRRVASSSPCLILVMRVERSVLKSASNEVAVLLLGGLKLIIGPGVFRVFDLHKMDVPLFWKELAKVMGLGSRKNGCGWC
eukprot:1139293-Pelagomonas_calceolata.AAC.1